MAGAVCKVATLRDPLSPVIRTPGAEASDECEAAFDLSNKNIRMPLEAHVEWSKKRVAKTFGVSTESLDLFFKAVRQKATADQKAADPTPCISDFKDSVLARSGWLLCLAGLGRNVLNESLLASMNDLRIKRLQNPEHKEEEQRTLALFAYVIDLVRESESEKGRKTAWINGKNAKIFGPTDFADFPYEPGDIVLTIGDSSVSSVISQSTFPPRKYSHAMIVGRNAESKLEIYETLIETGSIKQSEETFAARHLNSVLVLRYRGPGRDIPAKAATRARELAEAKIPYDTAMDFSNPDKLFCSEFVLRSYADAMGIDVQKIAPLSSEIRSDKVFNYLKSLGVNKKVMPAPGDLLSLENFEVVAEYRNSHDFIYLWGMVSMADVWMERLDAGFRMRNSLASQFKTRIGSFTDTVGSIVGTDWNLLPDSLSASSAATIMTQEDSFKRAYTFAIRNLAERFTKRSLLDVPLWEIRGHLSFALQEDSTLRSRFRP